MNNGTWKKKIYVHSDVLHNSSNFLEFDTMNGNERGPMAAWTDTVHSNF